MGGCMSHVEKEMQSPPQAGNWNGLNPQRPTPYVPRQQQMRKTNSGPIKRWETASGIPGLTYDQAGRPVWRDPKLANDSNSSVEVEHHEGK